MKRTPSALLLYVAIAGCASSTNSATGGADTGTPAPFTLDSGTHDATLDSPVVFVSPDTGTATPDTGVVTDTGVASDVAPPSTDATGDGTTLPAETGPTPDTGTTSDAPSGSDAGTAPTTCAEVHGGYGCCFSSTVVYYCGGDAGTTLKHETCTGNDECVYDTSGRYYHCGSPDAGASTTQPAACGVADAGTTQPDASTTSDAGKDSGSTSASDAAVPATCAEANGALGCCDGQTLWYCDGNDLIARKCTNGNVCGWAPLFGYYDCGELSGEAPNDTPPKACR